MGQRKEMSIEVAEVVWGKDFEPVPNPYRPDTAFKLVCRRCGKEYRPGSSAYMIRHIGDHMAESVA